MDIHEICEEERCHCEHGVISSAAFHTLKVFVYIFLISLVLNIIIGLVGEETLAGLFTGTPIAGELIAALVGLIPNCASSVVITQLYLDHIIGAGAMMAGLLLCQKKLILGGMIKLWQEAVMRQQAAEKYLNI